MFEFIDTIMLEFYKIIFNVELPRVLEGMKFMLQFTLDTRTGNSFLYKDHTIIRFYGFIDALYILPSFLTQRFFSLEFVRHKLHSKNEHFPSFRNSYHVKFSFKIEPFIIKNKASLHSGEIVKGYEFI